MHDFKIFEQSVKLRSFIYIAIITY